MTRTTNRPKPVVLCILDGWGHRVETNNNAIALGNTPNWDRLVETVPKSLLQASSADVGLPDGQMGNSEVGHTNLGAGRVVLQNLPRINAALAAGTLAGRPAMTGLIEKLKATGGTCHVMGLMSPGGVHSHQDHMVALAEIVAAAGVPVAIHAFLDGRDVPPKSAAEQMADFLGKTDPIDNVSMATVSGRFYALDRDTRWERVEQAYAAMVDARGETAANGGSAIEAAYARDETDEFVLPTVIDGYGGMNSGDGLLVANFRADRTREILSALVDADFDGFLRSREITFAACTGMIRYAANMDAHFETLFPLEQLNNILGDVVSDAGLTQLRIAETEKYAHVTFFFNGGREQGFTGEERILVPSPRVATYDMTPEMSAYEVTDKLIEAIRGDHFDVIIVNYANGDMVGHSGVLEAAIKATETVDACIGRLEAAVDVAGGVLLVTADHGNCEQMWDATQDPEQAHTAHTTDPVPLLMVNAPDYVKGLADGVLADIAPTMLRLMDIAKPDEMTGSSLIEEG
ncbi:MAG: 2,3-bisphosphoglycerate-independent phosphoglycerate mutase [Rhodospirillaceae bacterium]|nr:2,3-bisphosphoglycerate-independent phosphoglycerate mutase [Rhodospirillaceae bacterium]